MKKKIKRGSIGLCVILLIMSFHSLGWTQENVTNEEYMVFDLIIARPLSVAVGIMGVGIFILSLPFTIPTRSMDQAAKTFIVEPFKFSFVREFPDENI